MVRLGIGDRNSAHYGKWTGLWLLFLLVNLAACEDPPYDPSLYTIDFYNEQSGEYSLIEHPYIFEQYGLKLEKLGYRDQGDQTFMFGQLTGNTKDYEGCIFFVHAYPGADRDNFIAMGGALSLENERLVFQRQMADSLITSFQEVRMGMGCQGERLFGLSLGEVDLSKRIQ